MSPQDWPVILFIVTFALLWLAIGVGALIRIHARELSELLREDYAIVLGATLTLLGLIIGFTFSMATSRYDLRKSLEAAEANAIGTEYSRLNFLPADQAEPLRTLMRHYIDLRIQFYSANREPLISQINSETDSISEQMWGLVSKNATSNPSVLLGLVASGMNEVLDSRELAQAARWNRIPLAAWWLMFLIAALSNMMLGYGAKGRAPLLSLILPLTVGICFLLIADIDTPTGGLIRIHPQDLHSVAESMKAHSSRDF